MFIVFLLNEVQKPFIEMDRKRTRSSERQLKIGKKQCNTRKESKSSNPVIAITENDLTERQNRTHVTWEQQNIVRTAASAEIGGFPIPEHNFPTPLGPQERDYDRHPLIHEVNLAIRKLNMYRTHMFDDCGQHLPERQVLSRMKMFIENETLPVLTRNLKHEYLETSDNPNETLYPGSRDTLVNVGAGFFTIGLFLIMMGSNTDKGVEATAANYHLEKGVYSVNDSVCQTCGHTQCNKEKGCDPNVPRDVEYGRRWL